MTATAEHWSPVLESANAARSSAAAHHTVASARRALPVLAQRSRLNGPVQQWIQVLAHRIENPNMTLAELAESMPTPVTKNAYAALLRRALRAADRDLAASQRFSRTGE
ncbi:MAG: helix-turn-helix domain-containing protein [Mycobacterium sp.]